MAGAKYSSEQLRILPPRVAEMRSGGELALSRCESWVCREVIVELECLHGHG